MLQLALAILLYKLEIKTNLNLNVTSKVSHALQMLFYIKTHLLLNLTVNTQNR